MARHLPPLHHHHPLLQPRSCRRRAGSVWTHIWHMWTSTRGLWSRDHVDTLVNPSCVGCRHSPKCSIFQCSGLWTVTIRNKNIQKKWLYRLLWEYFYSKKKFRWRSKADRPSFLNVHLKCNFKITRVWRLVELDHLISSLLRCQLWIWMQAEEKSEGLELGFEFTGSCSSLVQAAVAWMCLTLIWAKSSQTLYFKFVVRIAMQHWLWLRCT